MSTRHPSHRGHRTQCGQALTEFLVVAVALMPLFLLIPVIAKYQGIAHTTQMASRYTAFDSLVRNDYENSLKPIAQLQDEVRRRFFSDSKAPIVTHQVARDLKSDQNLFWRTPDDKALIASFNDVTVARSVPPSHVGVLGGVDVGPFSGMEFGASGIYSAAVRVQLANLPANLEFYKPFDQINLVMTRNTSVLPDYWTGKNPADVQQQASHVTSSSVLPAALAAIVPNAIQHAEPGINPPHIGQLDFWSDTVPSDRLRRVP